MVAERLQSAGMAMVQRLWSDHGQLRSDLPAIAHLLRSDSARNLTNYVAIAKRLHSDF
jgi:hypothetical protein